MGHHLPPDVMRKLRQKYPEVKNLNNIISDVFEEIREKAIDDGSCLVFNFGTFYTYKTFSQRLGTTVARFKFMISRSFSNNLRDDSYIQTRIQRLYERIFDKEKTKNPQYVENNKRNIRIHQKILNSKTELKNISKEEHKVHDEIYSILEEVNSSETT